MWMDTRRPREGPHGFVYVWSTMFSKYLVNVVGDTQFVLGLWTINTFDETLMSRKAERGSRESSENVALDVQDSQKCLSRETCRKGG